jgi:arylsulfatase A-like enzyme
MKTDELPPPSLTTAYLQTLYILRLAVWFGLLSGFGELAGLGVQKFLLHQLIYFGWHIVWMAPLANLCVFVTVGLLYRALAWRWPKLASLRKTTGLFVFLSLLSWALLFPQLKFYAALLLAAGGAWRISGWLALHATKWATVRRLSTQAMFGVTLALGVAVYTWQSQSSAHAGASANQPSTAPNVLLLVLDTVRAQNLSVYGYARPTTPHLEQFARTGAKFARAFATAPWTLPSHASMFTGRLPHELSADFRTPLDARFPTLAETVRARGYATGGFVANSYYCNAENGLARGFTHYEDHVASLPEFLLSASLSRALLQRDALRRLFNQPDVIARKSAAQINGAFLHWLDQQAGQPFFAFLNYLDAHEPCVPPADYAKKFGAGVEHRRFRSAHLLRTSWRLQREQVTPQQNQADIDCYDGSISYLDAQLGQLLGALEQRGLRQNTLIVITSDHGEAFGEQGHYGHVDSAYISQLRVPLLLSWPGVIPPAQTITEPVSLRDLAATMLDLLKLPPLLPGESLAQHWRAHGDCEEEPLLSEINVAPILVRRYPAGGRALIKSLIVGRYHFLKNPNGRTELYDYESDPAEEHNLTEQTAAFELLLGASEIR